MIQKLWERDISFLWKLIKRTCNQHFLGRSLNLRWICLWMKLWVFVHLYVYVRVFSAGHLQYHCHFWQFTQLFYLNKQNILLVEHVQRNVICVSLYACSVSLLLCSTPVGSGRMHGVNWIAYMYSLSLCTVWCVTCETKGHRNTFGSQ